MFALLLKRKRILFLLIVIILLMYSLLFGIEIVNICTLSGKRGVYLVYRFPFIDKAESISMDSPMRIAKLVTPFLEIHPERDKMYIIASRSYYWQAIQKNLHINAMGHHPNIRRFMALNGKLSFYFEIEDLIKEGGGDVAIKRIEEEYIKNGFKLADFETP